MRLKICWGILPNEVPPNAPGRFLLLRLQLPEKFLKLRIALQGLEFGAGTQAVSQHPAQVTVISLAGLRGAP